jgi:hypothetical protein
MSEMRAIGAASRVPPEPKRATRASARSSPTQHAQAAACDVRAR